MPANRSAWIGVCVMLAARAIVTVAAVADEPFDAARQSELEGKYEEAAEQYRAQLADEPVRAAVGLARTQAAVGQLDEAAATLEAAAAADADSPAPHAELARLAFDRGDYAAAAASVKAALEADADHLAARWIAAELDRVAGRLDEADAGYHWFVEYYNAHQVDDPDALRYIGLAAAQYARWHRLADQFDFLVNELYAGVLESEPNYWQAHYDAGRLYLEKYNQADAGRELSAALKLNPRAAEAYAAVAEMALQQWDLDEAVQAIDRALELNPRLLAAQQLRADVAMANFDTTTAIERLQGALELNPVAEETLGRLAAAYVAEDDLPDDPTGTRVGRLIDEVTSRNPHCGVFFLTMARRLEERRKFPAAEFAFRQAIERMPVLVGPRAGLGMMYMRLGREEEAARLLAESFEIDPFNVRVSNTLKVLELLDGYDTIETDHFIIKFDPAHDALLARCAAEHLESVYPELCEKLGYEPAGKSLFEFFNRAKNTNGHGWFSARMVGLPYVGTVGACAGTMVAMASPNDQKQKFNWGVVLKHEFVHVINLQQTNFNIPHWFTEALAVWNEGYPRSQLWNQLLAERVPKGELFDLDSINLGFIRPQSSIDWQMAYCQAELYAEYMLAEYGEPSHARLLAAYAENLSTRDAIERAMGVTQEEFETGYRRYLDGVVAGLTTAAAETEMSPAELQRAVAADPDDADLAARLAVAYLARKSYPQARKLARRALEHAPGHQLATYVVARLHLLVGDTKMAVDELAACLDRTAPDENVLKLLAGLRMAAEQYDEAADLYQLGAQQQPYDRDWIRRLASVYLRSGDDHKLKDVLVQLAETDSDDLLVRKKLAQMALAAGEQADAARWANDAIHIDVMDGDAHRMAAEALAGTGDAAAAAAAYEAAVELDTENHALRLDWARQCIAAGERDRARQVIESLLARDPDHEQAKQLLEQLEP